jgi:hypothetical protein
VRERLGVEFRFKAYAEADDVLALSPDLVVVVTADCRRMKPFALEANSRRRVGRRCARRCLWTGSRHNQRQRIDQFGAEADNDVRYAQGSDGQLILDDSASFFGNIYQMAVGDSIDLRDFAYNSANPSAMKLANSSTTRPGDSGFSALDGDLQITNGTSLSSNLHLEGDYQSATWTFKADALGGTIITLRRQSRPERRQRERIVKPEAQGEH